MNPIRALQLLPDDGDYDEYEEIAEQTSADEGNLSDEDGDEDDSMLSKQQYGDIELEWVDSERGSKTKVGELPPF